MSLSFSSLGKGQKNYSELGETASASSIISTNHTPLALSCFVAVTVHLSSCTHLKQTHL